MSLTVASDASRLRPQGACATLAVLVALLVACVLCTCIPSHPSHRTGACFRLWRSVRRAFDLRDSFYQLTAPRSDKGLNFDVINGMRTLSMVRLASLPLPCPNATASTS